MIILLFTKEFFKACLIHLKESGIMNVVVNITFYYFWIFFVSFSSIKTLLWCSWDILLQVMTHLLQSHNHETGHHLYTRLEKKLEIRSKDKKRNRIFLCTKASLQYWIFTCDSSSIGSKVCCSVFNHESEKSLLTQFQ